MYVKVGNIVNAQITKINSKYIEARTEDGWNYRILIEDISDWHKTINLYNTFNLNQTINFVIKSFDLKNKTGMGDFKANHPNFARNPFQHLLEETKGGFANLKEHAIAEFEEQDEY